MLSGSQHNELEFVHQTKELFLFSKTNLRVPPSEAPQTLMWPGTAQAPIAHIETSTSHADDIQHKFHTCLQSMLGQGPAHLGQLIIKLS